MANKIKSIFKSVLSFMEEAGRARAAAVLARQGKHKEAYDLIMGK